MSHLVWACTVAANAAAANGNEQGLELHVFLRGQFFRRAATSSANASDAVNPGDSMPNRLTSPGTPCSAGPWMHEIGGRLPGRGDLRPDAGVARRKRAVRQRRASSAGSPRRSDPRAADRLRSLIRSTHSTSGPKRAWPAEVQRHVHAQAAGLGHRVDQAREGRAAGERVVVALGIELRRDLSGGKAVDQARDAGRTKPRAVDEDGCSDSCCADLKFKILGR